jgi:hypothetical protein
MELEMHDLLKSKEEVVSELEEKSKLLEISKQEQIRLLVRFLIIQIILSNIQKS